MSTSDSANPAGSTAPPERYLFETCFDSERPDRASPDEEPEPVFNAEDLLAAGAASYAEGEAAGRQEALSAIENQLQEGLGHLMEQMRVLTEDQARFQRTLTERSVALALKATRKLFPALAQRDGLAEIDALLTDCLSEAREEPRILVRVAADLADPYRERVDALAAAVGYEGTMTVMPDEAFGSADCRIEWSNGGAERNAERIWRDFDEAIGRIFSKPTDKPDSEIDTTPHPVYAEHAVAEESEPAAPPDLSDDPPDPLKSDAQKVEPAMVEPAPLPAVHPTDSEVTPPAPSNETVAPDPGTTLATDQTPDPAGAGLPRA